MVTKFRVSGGPGDKSFTVTPNICRSSVWSFELSSRLKKNCIPDKNSQEMNLNAITKLNHVVHEMKRWCFFEVTLSRETAENSLLWPLYIYIIIY